MKKMISTFLISTALTASLAACSNSDNCENKPASGSQKIMGLESDQLTADGEQLMDADHWMQADPLFAKALEKNPNDIKAQFYRAVLKPFLLTKGLATRVKPLIRQHGDLARYEARLQEMQNSPSKTFLLDGQEDIATLEQVQTLLVEQRQAFTELRHFLKQHEDMELDLSSPEISKKMNAADLIVMRQAVSGIILNYDLATNYSVEGAARISHQLADSRLSVEQKQQLIASVPTLGKLRKDHGFNEILHMGADFAAAAQWALQYQDRLCAGGQNAVNRPGYVLEKGICISHQDQATHDLALLNQSLNGPIAILMKTAHYGDKSTLLDAHAFLSKPVQDLRTIAPRTYSSCGEVTSLNDTTVGGLFPHSDADEFLPRITCVH